MFFTVTVKTRRSKKDELIRRVKEFLMKAPEENWFQEPGVIVDGECPEVVDVVFRGITDAQKVMDLAIRIGASTASRPLNRLGRHKS